MKINLKTVELTNENINEYLGSIADIHHQMFPKSHLTANFSIEKTQEYYQSIINASDLTIVIIDTSPNNDAKHEVLGYIVSGKSVSDGVSMFLKNNQSYVFLILLKKPALLFNKFKTIVSSRIFGSFISASKFRLLSIAISNTAKSKGIGTALLSSFEDHLKEKGILTYGLSVKSNNKKAISFYKRNNFILEKQLKNSKYYTKKLP